jgi:murein DD-endopeptidase MepM/ murein hydrolase activator NlpD
MKKTIRPKRLYVHLSHYDDQFITKKRDWTPLKRLIVAIGLLPAFITFIFPSFKIARKELRAPSFSVPTEMHAGEAFTIPVSDEVISVRAYGRPLSLTGRATQVYLGAVGVDETAPFSIDLAYKPEPRPKISSWLKRFTTHPTVYYYTQTIHVIPAPSNVISRAALPARVVANYDIEESLDNVIPNDVASMGHSPTVEAGCWKAPLNGNLASLTLMPFGVMRSKVSGSSTAGAYRHIGLDLYTNQGQSVMAAGPGLVVSVTDKPHPGRTVIISHGGGLFSRYTHLKDAIVRKGDKVKAGEEIGVSGPARKFEAPRLHWDVFYLKKPINPQSFLALSSQLCDLK